jgi:hypothetical protein
MRGFIVLAMFVVGFAQADGNGFPETRELSLEAVGLSELVIDAGAGSLTVTGVDEATAVTVVAIISVDTRDEAEARESIDRYLELTLERRGDEAILVSDFAWGAPAATVDLDVSVPVGMALKIDDGSGSTKVSNVRSDVRVEDGSGSISIINAASVNVDDGSGSILIEGATGDVYVNDGSGSIEIRGVGGSVRIDDGSGSIDIHDVERDLIIENEGSGSLTYKDIRGNVERDS